MDPAEASEQARERAREAHLRAVAAVDRVEELKRRQLQPPNAFGRAETAAQVTKALRRYRRLRRSRVAKVQRLAEQQGRIYHMAGPIAVARDLSIRVLGPKRVLARQRWIHDWKI